MAMKCQADHIYPDVLTLHLHGIPLQSSPCSFAIYQVAPFDHFTKWLPCLVQVQGGQSHPPPPAYPPTSPTAGPSSPTHSPPEKPSSASKQSSGPPATPEEQLAELVAYKGWAEAKIALLIQRVRDAERVRREEAARTLAEAAQLRKVRPCLRHPVVMACNTLVVILVAHHVAMQG